MTARCNFTCDTSMTSSMQHARVSVVYDKCRHAAHTGKRLSCPIYAIGLPDGGSELLLVQLTFGELDCVPV